MKLAPLKQRLSNQALAWLCVAALLFSLLPLYALSFYNHACYDDFGFSILTHDAWRDSGSWVQTLRAALQAPQTALWLRAMELITAPESPLKLPAARRPAPFAVPDHK